MDPAPNPGSALPAHALALEPAAVAMAEVRRVLDQALRELAIVVRHARRHGRVDAAHLAPCAGRIAALVPHHAQLLFWWLHTGCDAHFLYRRAVGTAVVAAALGEHLGLDPPTLRAVACGGLLLDIGKIAVPVPILAKPTALDGAEQAYVRRHVERGLDMLAAEGVPARSLEMLGGHHERLDGSGYPHGLRGTRIPLFGRLAAIADAYDAMTLNRRYAAGLSPHAALRQLEQLRGEKFDAALVGELMHLLGPYPAGTFVELTDSTLGLVWAHRHSEPRRPQILVTHDASRRALAAPRLAENSIQRSLPPHIVPLDMRHLELAIAVLMPAHRDARA
jgi:HD-GYP domain-containing protein (c-di-GMP phosphodiesterase class II)